MQELNKIDAYKQTKHDPKAIVELYKTRFMVPYALTLTFCNYIFVLYDNILIATAFLWCSYNVIFVVFRLKNNNLEYNNKWLDSVNLRNSNSHV